MSKLSYYKLVRSKIPEFIQKKEPHAVIKWHEVEGAEQQGYLCQKLREEAEEFYNTPNVEELADVLSVIEAIMVHFNFDKADLDKVRIGKDNVRGTFIKGVVLETVELPEPPTK